jgi:hypothetical protein
MLPQISAPPLVFDSPEVQLLPGEKKFRWSKAANMAAQYVAEGNLYYKDIALKLDIPVHRVTKWKAHTEFKARVESLRAQYRDYVGHKGIAQLAKRLDTYLDDWESLEAIRKGRANQPLENSLPIPSQLTVEGETLSFDNPPGSVIQEGGAVPGSGMFNPAGGIETGFIVKDYKGKDADQPVYSFDKSLWDARLKLREQIGRETGQWTDKSKIQSDQPQNQVNVTNITVTATLSEHLIASRRAARSGIIIDVGEKSRQLVEGNPTSGRSCETGSTTTETGDAGG